MMRLALAVFMAAALGCGDSGTGTTATGDTTGTGTADTGTTATTTDTSGDTTTTDTGDTTTDTGTTDTTDTGEPDDTGTVDTGGDTVTGCNCDDGNGCTKDVCLADGSCEHPPLKVPDCSPSVSLSAPARGVTLPYQKKVGIEGTSFSPIGIDAHLTVNGAELNFAPDGSFNTTLVNPTHGINILSAQLADPVGQARAVQTFLMGEGFYDTTNGASEQASVTNGLVVFLGKDLWDDDDLSDVDDVATVVHLVLENTDILALIPYPITGEGDGGGFGWCEWTVYVTKLEYNVYSVNVKPAPGGVVLSGTLTDLVIGFDAKAPGFLCPDAVGTASAAVVTIGAYAAIELNDDGEIAVTIAEDDLDVVLGTLEFDITAGAAGALEWLANWFGDTIGQYVELAIEGALVDVVAPMLSGLLEGMGTYVQSFEIPAFLGITSAVPVTVTVAPSYIYLSSDGAVVGVEISATTPQAVPELSTYGSLARNGCFEADEQSLNIPTDAHIAVALHDDLINQGLFAAWWGGLMNVSIDPATIELVLKDDLPVPGLQVDVQPFLPPVLTSCTPNGKTRLQIGDLRIAASFLFDGKPASVVAFVSASFEIDLAVAAGENGTLDISFGVSQLIDLDFELVETTGAIEGAKNLLQLIVTNVVEDVVVATLADGIFKSFPIPKFDISALIPGVPAETILGFDPKTLERIEGYTVLNGTVVD